LSVREAQLDDCGCCETPGLGPLGLENRPSLDAISYRIGTQPVFKARMKVGIGARQELAGLTSRDDSDPAMALVDAWACVLDVLTFYQERIANEGYLRTATETRSVYSLAAEIGYVPNPGVAADVMLAFQLDTSPGAPRTVTIPAETTVQSLPDQASSSKPQTFETVEALEARQDWNEMRPRRSVRQRLGIGAVSAVLAGMSAQLQTGDGLLFIGHHRQVNPKSQHWDFRVLESVKTDTVAGTTTVTWGRGLGDTSVGRKIHPEHSDLHIYTMTTHAGVFGFNAPDWRQIPLAIRGHYDANDTTPQWPHFTIFGSKMSNAVDLDSVYPEAAKGSYAVLALENYAQLYTIDAATEAARADFGLSGKTTRLSLNGPGLGNFARHVRGTVVHLQDGEVTLADLELSHPVQGHSIPLDLVVEGLEPGKKLIVTGKRARAVVSGQTHQLKLEPSHGSGEVLLAPGESLQMTSPFTKSQQDGSHVWHVRAPGRQEGTVSGPASTLRWTPARDSDEPISEVVTLKAVELLEGMVTRLELEDDLVYCYDRASLKISGNAVHGTHGETRHEVLGSGDASRPFQAFKLKQSPLTFVSSADPSGAKTTLEVRVDDVAWEQTPTLFGLGPRDRAYVVRIAADGGVTVEFGDGVTGARLPTGVENVRATYRVGTGTSGMVAADRIKLLMTRPLGVQAVDNPVAAGIAADPEPIDSARSNAPQQVVTFARVVSLTDFEDFARSFAGIAKAQAAWVWNGQSRMVHVTVAGTDGAAVVEGGETQTKLVASITAYSDPHQRFRVSSYDELSFALAAALFLEEGADESVVLPAARLTLQDAFSFDRRALGQPVFESEVIAVLQSTPGVMAVDLTKLYYAGGVPEDKPPPALAARRARWDGKVLKPAQLLTLTDEPVLVKLEVAT